MRTATMTRRAADKLASQTLEYSNYVKVGAYKGWALCPLLTCRERVEGHAHPNEQTCDLGMHRALADHIHTCPKQF